MRTQHLPVNRPLPRRAQAGFINVLLVMLAGMGALALTAVGMHSIRSAQDQQTSLHANTQAVTRAWDGVEVVRRYLSMLTADELQALRAGPLAVNGLANVDAKIVSSALAGTEFRVVADITGTGVGTNATVRVMFAVPSAGANPAGPPAGPGPNGGGGADAATKLYINGDLNMTGGIEVLGENRELWVSGNVDLGNGGGASIQTISKICAGGNVSIGSSVFVNEICTNGNLLMTGGATAGLAQVKGSVTLQNNAAGDNFSAAVATVKANGNVTLEGNATVVEYLETQGDVVVKSGGNLAKTVNAQGNVDYLSSLGGGNAALSNLNILINANGNVLYKGPNYNTVINTRGNATLSENGNVQTLTAQGNITLNGTWWVGVQGTVKGGGNFSYVNGNVAYGGSVKGNISPAPDGTRVLITQDSSLEVSVPKVKVADIDFPAPSAPTVDVYTLKDSANYVFTYEDGKRKVTVKNVSGVADGTYYLGTVYRDYNYYPDHLCTSVNSSGMCADSEWHTARTLCQGYSPQNGCIEAPSAWSNKWSLNGQSLAPGVVWFDRDLNLGVGVYFNTFAVAGSINTSGSTKVYAPNYAGYSVVCSDTGVGNYALTRDSRLAGMYPKQFCDFTNHQFVSKSLGNAALIAGGYSTPGTYVGGLIALDAANEIYGNVLAGDRLTTSGGTTVHGIILVSGLGTTTSGWNNTRANTWSGKTVIDLRNTPSTFNADDNVCMDPVHGCEEDKGPGGPGGPAHPLNQTRVFWTSYR